MPSRGKITVRNKWAGRARPALGPAKARGLIPSADSHFERRRLAEKGLWAGRKTIGAGHEDRDDVADLRARRHDAIGKAVERSEEHTSELQSLMRTSYAVF